MLTDSGLDRLLAAPTLGAWRRQHGYTGWCAEARVALAVAVAQEAMRRELIDRLDGLARFASAGADLDQVLVRLADLVDEVWPTVIHDVIEKAA